jgi:hypothetical protein
MKEGVNTSKTENSGLKTTVPMMHLFLKKLPGGGACERQRNTSFAG